MVTPVKKDTTKKATTPKPPATTPAPTGAKSEFQKTWEAMQASGGTQTMPSSTYQTTIQQTSAPDIEAIVQGAMQQMAGRYATPEEVKRLGAALLAEEKANPTTYAGETTYQTGTHVKANVTGQTVNTGVSAQNYIQTLLTGTADVKEYTAATQYMNEIMKANNQFKGAYSG